MWSGIGWISRRKPIPARMMGVVYEKYTDWIGVGRVGEVVGWPTTSGRMIRMEDVDKLFKVYDAQS